MKYCSNCSREISTAGSFCPFCGGSLTNAADLPHSSSPYDTVKPKDSDYNDSYSVNEESYRSRTPIDFAEIPEPDHSKVWATLTTVLICIVALFGTAVVLKLMGVISFNFDKKENTSSVISEVQTDSEKERESETDTQKEIVSPEIGMKAVPDVEDFMQETAIGVLAREGFNYALEYDDNPERESGIVLRQYPAAETMAAEGATVTLIVSRKPEVSESSKSEASKTYQTVPNVVGMTIGAAENSIKKEGLTPIVGSYEYSDTVDANCVISQSPAAKNSAEKGSEVYLVLSKGIDPSKYVYIGSYIGMKYDDVKATLEKSGVKVKANYEQNDYYDKGLISSQSVGADQYMKKGQTITFTVSNGKPAESKAEPSKPESKPESKQENTSSQNYVKPIFNGVDASSTHAKEGSITYEPLNALHDDDTCWCEGASGKGIGEYFILTATNPQTVTGVTIENGYTKNADTFKNNGRISKVTFEFSDGTACTADLDPDFNGLMSIDFPAPVSTTYLKIIITDAVSGDKYDDTCITLVMPY